jgi:hypothetical protein
MPGETTDPIDCRISHKRLSLQGCLLGIFTVCRRVLEVLWFCSADVMPKAPPSQSRPALRKV